MQQPLTHVATEQGEEMPPSRRFWARRSMPLALGWSVITALLALSWWAGVLPHPFGDAEAATVGAVLNTADPRVGTVLTLSLGLLGVAAAVAALHPGARRDSRVARATLWLSWLLAAVPLLVLVHGHLLAFLGYTPVVLTLGWFDASLRSAYLAELTDPDTLFLLHSTAGGLLWGMAALAHGRTLRRACGDCGRYAGWSASHERATRARALRIGRYAVAVGVVSALGYPSMRLPWLLGIPVGVDAESWRVLQATPGMTATGVALGTAGLVGAALMLGLVRNWGVRFPRWTPPLAGRRVPVSLAVVPAAVVAVGFVAFGRGFVTGIATGVLTTPAGTDALHLAALAALLPWGLALAVATAAYALRRRGECHTCGLGLPEELPRPSRRAAPPERSLVAASPR